MHSAEGRAKHLRSRDRLQISKQFVLRCLRDVSKLHVRGLAVTIPNLACLH